MTSVNGVTFDLAQTAPVSSSAGYTRTTRDALKNEGLVKFRESFVKKLVKTLLASSMQVSSYKPTEMNDKNNFFYAMAQFAQAAMFFATWFRTHFADNVFTIVETYVIPGDPNANPPTADTVSVRPVGDLFKVWNAVTLDQVFASCELYMKYSTSGIEAQNLNLTWEFFMVNIDVDLRASVIAEVSRFQSINADAAQSGPMAFWVIANRIIQSTDALAHNVVTGVMGMGLLHFKGENVIDAIATLRNVLLFLGHGTPRSKCPPTLMDILFDVFLRCSNPTFVNYIRHLKDFEQSAVDTPEKLFTKAQTYYTDLFTKPNGWIRTTKTRAAFLASLPELSAAMQADLKLHEEDRSPSSKPSALTSSGSPPNTPSPKPSGSSSSSKGLPTHDGKGNLIDRTPPKQGESHIRTNSETNRKEFWCDHARCKRWGSHTTDRHDSWFEKMKLKRAEWQAKKNGGGSKPSDTSGDAKDSGSSTVPSMHHAKYCAPTLLRLHDNDDDSH